MRFTPSDYGQPAWTEAAMFVLDIAEDEDTSPASSSPFNGWVGWATDQLLVGWQNAEQEAHGTATLPRPFEIDERPSERQLAELARLIVRHCFGEG